MNPEQFYEHIVLWIRNRWPHGTVWGDAQAGAIANDFRHVPIPIAAEALDNLFREGYQQAPSPSKVMKQCRLVADQRGINVDGIESPCTRDDHVWAILEERNGIQQLLCARCKTETTKATFVE